MSYCPHSNNVPFLKMSLRFLWFTFILHLSGADDIKGPPLQSGSIDTKHISKVGDTIKLPCPIDGNPKPMKTWFKGTLSINIAWPRFKVTSKGLKITDLIAEDSGRYTCKAVNGFGSVQIDMELVVLDPESAPDVSHPGSDGEHIRPTKPSFVHISPLEGAAIKRQEGTNIVFRCTVEGYPRPEITWYKGEEVLTLIPEETNGTSRNKGQLHLSYLNDKDSGVYTCRAYNYLGEIEHTFNLQVTDGVAPKKPLLVDQHPVDTTVKLGDVTSLQCKVQSEETPHVQWLKRVEDGDVVPANRTIKFGEQRLMTLSSTDVVPVEKHVFLNKLVLTHVKEKDAGLYICLAANSHGFNYREAVLQVRVEDTSLPISVVITLPVVIVLFLAIIGVWLLFRRKKSAAPHCKDTIDVQKSLMNPNVVQSSSSSTPSDMYPKESPYSYPYSSTCDPRLPRTTDGRCLRHNFCRGECLDYRSRISECSGRYMSNNSTRSKDTVGSGGSHRYPRDYSDGVPGHVCIPGVRWTNGNYCTDPSVLQVV